MPASTATDPAVATAPTPPVSQTWSGRTLAVLVLRLWLGTRAVLAGLEKYSAKITVQEPLLDSTVQPDMSGAMLDVDKKCMA